MPGLYTARVTIGAFVVAVVAALVLPYHTPDGAFRVGFLLAPPPAPFVVWRAVTLVEVLVLVAAALALLVWAARRDEAEEESVVERHVIYARMSRTNAERRLLEELRRYLAPLGVTVPERRVMGHQEFRAHGWLVQVVRSWDGRGPYLEVYAHHPDYDDRHHRLHADGRLKTLPALEMAPPAPDRAYYKRNRTLARRLHKTGFTIVGSQLPRFAPPEAIAA